MPTKASSNARRTEIRLVTSTDLRGQLSKVLEGLHKGQTFTLTHYGQPVGVIVPWQRAQREGIVQEESPWLS